MKELSPRWIALVGLTALAVYLCWLVVQPFLGVLAWATVLTIVANPVCAWLRRRGWSANLAAAMTMVLIFIVVLVPLGLVGMALVKEAKDAAPAVHDGVLKLLDPQTPWMKKLAAHPELREALKTDAIANKLKDLTNSIASLAISLAGNVLTTIVQVFFILFALFYLLRDSDRILSSIRSFLPLDPAQSDHVFASTRSVVYASLYGVIFIAVIQALLGGLAFWVLRLSSPLLWMVVMFFAALIPLVGTSLVWGPAALYFLAIGSVGKAITLVIWGILVIGMADNILRPRLVGQKTRLHELVVFFSVLGGLKVFGPLGMVMGPLVVALAIAMVKIFQQVDAVKPVE